MRGLRPLVLLAGAAALLSASPCSALVWPDPAHERTPVDAMASPGLKLLRMAAWTSTVRPWTGVQRVVSLSGGLPRFSVVKVAHTPGLGSDLHVVASGQAGLVPDVLDARMLGVLAGHYDVVLSGWQACAGRRAQVLEARRPGLTGPRAVAGRFWLDPSSGMVLRRDVLDAAGAVVRTTAFDDLKVGPLLPVHQPASSVAAPGKVLDDGALRALEAQGWPVVHVLPAGLELFEARMLTEAATDAGDAGVLQLSYSDGLSTLSLFVQDGDLSSKPPGTARPVGGGTVWVSAGNPQRVVWSGEGRTWTLVSDAPESTVDDALLVLPHTAAPVGDSPVSRVWRGMAVVGSWLNPFE